MSTIRLLMTILLMMIGAVSTFALNFFFLEHLLIPDPCYYHNRDTSLLFDLFYDLASVEGGHPSPTGFNLLLTLAVGLLSGYQIANWRRKKTAHNRGFGYTGGGRNLCFRL